MQDHYWRMHHILIPDSHGIQRRGCMWLYKDLYAIYADGSEDHSDILNNHPEWILKDASGYRLYINWACSGGTCPQYAGDIGNPAFRTYWVSKATEALVKSYLGAWIDDVNLDWRIGDGNGQFVAPIDSRTGTAMTLADWKRYFVEFTEQIREAMPNKEILHNVLWHAGPTSDPLIARQIKAADYIHLERGINDSGLVGGNGNFGVESFFPTSTSSMPNIDTLCF